MKCPYCDQKLKVGLKLLFIQKCPHCNKNIWEGNKRKYNLLSGISLVICLALFVLLIDYGNVFHINETVFEIIAFVVCFSLRCVFELILLTNYYRLIK